MDAGANDLKINEEYLSKFAYAQPAHTRSHTIDNHN